MKTILNAVRKHPAYLRTRPFYKRYPKRSSVKLSWLDSRGVVDFDTGAFYSRVPKAANSFIMLELFKLRSREVLRHQEVKKLYPYPSSLTAAQVNALDSLIKFTFVRNPYTRTLSAYLDKIRNRAAGPVKRIMRNRLPIFSEFCQYLDDGGLNENIHWAPQASIILLPVADFDLVGKMENLDADWPHVRRHLKDLTGRGLEDTQHQFYRAPAVDIGKLPEHYDPTSTEIVTRLFADDFRLFDYEVIQN